MGTYEAISLMISFSLYTLMLISLIIVVIKAINRERK